MAKTTRLPLNIRRFVWLWFGSAAIAIASIPIQPQDPAIQAKIGSVAYMEMLLVAEMIAVLLLLPFVWLAAWRRKNWARWCLLAINILMLPLFLAPPISFYTDHLLPTTCTLLGTIMGLASLYFLFAGDARAWFQKQGEA